MFQQFDAGGRNSHRASENKSAERVRRDDDGYEREERIIDEGARVNGDLVEAKNEGNQSCHDRVQPEEWREGNEDSD